MFTTVHQWTLSGTTYTVYSVHTLTNIRFKIHFNIIFLSASSSSKWHFSFKFSSYIYSSLKKEALDRPKWTARFRRGFEPVVRQINKFLISPLISNQSTRYSISWCAGWLAGSLTCKLPNVVRSPPARRSRKFSHYWLMFGSSFTRFV
jgi:hypothetical protein